MNTPTLPQAVAQAIDRYAARPRHEQLEDEAQLRAAWVLRDLARQGILVPREAVRELIGAEIARRRAG
jgi:hypothetical protein